MIGWTQIGEPAPTTFHNKSAITALLLSEEITNQFSSVRHTSLFPKESAQNVSRR